MVAVNQIRDEYRLEARADGVNETKAAAEGLAGAVDKVTTSADKQERKVISVQRALEKFAASNDQAFKAQQQVERAQALVNRAFEQGLSGTRAYERAAAALAEKQAHLARVTAQVAAANDNAAAKARGGWSALSAQGAAQEKSIQANERAAAQWRNLSAQGSAQARSLENLRAANDNVATGFAAQGAQIGALLPGYSKLIALAGALGAVFTAGQFVQTVTSFQAIEASLRAATGSTEAAQSAMAFVRSESDRLGLSLGSTAKDFTSFAAATRGTELEGEKTRKVFSAVAEAGTVLGLSADDMSGALLALSQMASKGTVSSEELRGQLGERLPGAFNIAAKAMGVTTSELGKMLEQGQVLASDFLPKFADAMHEAFGPEAANASKNLQANLNRLQTAVTDLFLAAGKGGLTEALNDAVRQTTAFLRSSQDTAAGVGGALASGLRTAATAFQFLRQNSELAGAALAALLALRFGPSIIEIAAGAARAASMVGVYDVATRQLVVSQTAAIASSRALSVAMGAFGGPIGLALTAAAAGVAYLALRQDEGTKAAEAQAAGLKTLDAALQQHKGSLASASDETKKLAAEQLAAAQAAVEAARLRLSQAQAKAADNSPQVGVAGFEAFSTAAGQAEDASFQLGAAQADLDDKVQRSDATMRRLAGTATDADRALLGLPPTISAVTAQVDAAIPSMQKYGDALSKLIAMVPELAKAVEAQGKLTQARSLFDEGTVSAQKAYLKGEISQNEMVDRVAKVKEVYERATSTVSGYEDALAKVDTRMRSASIGAMEAQAGEVAKLRDSHDAYVKSLSEGERASLTSAQRNDLVAKSEQALAQEISNVNSKYAEREAKKAGSSATKEAAKDAREATREFESFEKQADAAFQKLFPEEALKKKGEALQALLDKFRDQLNAVDPRLVQAMETKIRLNLDGKDIEGIKGKTDDLSKEMSSAFRGVFDEMFSAGNKGFDGLLASFTKSLSRIGTRLLESTFLTPLFGGGKEGGAKGGLDLFSSFDFSGIEKAVSEGSFSGIFDGISEWLKPGGEGGKGGFASSKLGGGLMAAGVGASIGYSSQNPIIGAVGGGLAGFAAGAAAGGTMGPIGAVIGAGAGLIGGLLGQADAKKAAKKRIQDQLKAYREAYEEAKPQIDQLRKTLRGESLGAVGAQIDEAFQQAKAANKTASQGGDQKTADQIMVEYTQFAFRLRDSFMHAFEGTLKEVAAGFGTSGPFAQAAAAVTTLGESLKAFVKDSESLPEAESNSARARAAAIQAALAAIDPPEALSDTQQEMARINGTAAGLERVLRDLGMSAEAAAVAIRDKTATAMEALRAQFSADLGAKINEATGKGYLNEVADLIKERDGLLADAQAIGAGTDQVSAYFRAAAQEIINGSELTGDAFNALVTQFPALQGAVVEFGQAVDTAAAKAEAAARALGYQDRAFAAGNDTSTQAGALAAFARREAQERAAEVKAGGQAMADLEKALAAERAAIIRDFAAQALEAEKATAEASARRVLSAEDRLFAALNDTSTFEGKLAEMTRQHAQERLEEVAAGGQALAALEKAQAAERLKLYKEAGEAQAAALKEAQAFLDGAAKNIKSYLDGLKAGPETNLSPGARLAEAQKQFAAQMKLAKGGDRDALGSITQYADRLLDAGQANFASGKGYQDILGAVTKQLGALPKQVSAEQLIVDAIKGQTKDLQTALKANSPALIQKALANDFASIDLDASGGLTEAEFLAGIGDLATEKEQREAQHLFKMLDTNGDKLLSRTELMRGQLLMALQVDTPAAMAAALKANFTSIDVNSDELLTIDEFKAALGPLATEKQQKDANHLFRVLDENGDSTISRLELARFELKEAIKANSPDLIQRALALDFSKLDANTSGSLTETEFLAGLGDLASAKQQKDALHLFRVLDRNGDKLLDKTELMRGQLLMAVETKSPAALATAIKTNFPALDLNKDSFVSLDEFKSALTGLATEQQQKDALKVFNAIDLDGNGLLDELELAHAELKKAIEDNSPELIRAALSTEFGKIDLDASGGLTETEFLAGLGGLASAKQQKDALHLFRVLDKNGDKLLDRTELMRGQLLLALETKSPAALAEAIKTNFPALDLNADSVLSVEEFKSALSGIATEQQQKDALDVFKAIDLDGNGVITAVELFHTQLKDAVEANSPAAIQKALEMDFDALDKNTSGSLTADEFVAGLGPLATEKQQKDANHLFRVLDTNGDKLLDRTELMRGQLLTAMRVDGPHKMAAVIKKNFPAIDLNKDSFVSLEEYKSALGGLATEQQQKDALAVFNSIDSDGNGLLSELELTHAELKAAIEANSPGLIQAALKADFAGIDLDTSGSLTETEFVNGLKGLATEKQQRDAAHLFRTLDRNGDRLLDETELMHGQLALAIAANSPSAMATAIHTNFPKLDVNDDNVITLSEYSETIKGLATKKEQEDAWKLFDAIDKDGDKVITKLEAALVAIGTANTNIGDVKSAINDNFRTLDEDGSGGLSLTEFLKPFGTLATKAEQDAAKLIFQSIDKDGNDIITKLETTSSDLEDAIKLNSASAFATALKDNFPTIDVNSDGGITYAEMVTALGPTATKAQQLAAERLFRELDKNGDGTITKLEAVRGQLLEQLKHNGPSKVASAISRSFEQIDLNANAAIDWKEFVSAVKPETEAERIALKKVFDNIDQDGNDLLDKMETTRFDLQEAIKTNSGSAFATALKDNFPTIDVNSDGGISYDEMVKALLPLATKEEQAAAKLLFDRIDKDGDKIVTRVEAAQSQLLAQLKHNSPSKMAYAIARSFTEIDLNTDAAIDWEEFVSAVKPETEAERKALKAVFDNIDQDGNNLLTRLELTQSDLKGAIEANSASAFATALKNDFPTIDVNSDGGISYEEMVRALGGKATQAEQLKAETLFRELDKNGDRTVTQLEAARAQIVEQLKHNGPSKVAYQIARSFTEIDLNANAAIDWSEFLNVVKPETEAERTALKAVFDSIDADGNLVISAIEAANAAITDAVKANDAQAFATALDDNFKTLDTSVNGVLDKTELAAAIKGLSTDAEIKAANEWLKLIDTDNDGMLTKTETIAGRLHGVKLNTKDITEVKNNTGNTNTNVKGGNEYAKLSKMALDAIKSLSGSQNRILGELKGSSDLQKQQLELLTSQNTLDPTKPIILGDQTLQNNMITALNKIVFNTANTVIAIKSGEKYGAWSYASGGYTGPGGMYEAAGTVHRGEIVWSQADIARAGGVAAVEALRLGAAPMQAMAMPVPIANDNGALVAGMQRQIALLTQTVALLQAGNRIAKEGSEKVVSAVEENTEEVAEHRGDDKKREARQMAVAGGRR
ncbi:tape measure protein [Methylobacterium sp. Leaf118]|uniref:tape measure protein n=1 Tax=Methylobacterium sp. Leaf118 TaxID=2876562 RepID=UPI001E64B989|nr:tape measure protein [Methylobacterium sp. Leaf118]